MGLRQGRWVEVKDTTLCSVDDASYFAGSVSVIFFTYLTLFCLNPQSYIKGDYNSKRVEHNAVTETSPGTPPWLSESSEKARHNCLSPERWQDCSPRPEISYQTDVRPLKESQGSRRHSVIRGTVWHRQSRQQGHLLNSQVGLRWLCSPELWQTHTVGSMRSLPPLLIPVHHARKHVHLEELLWIIFSSRDGSSNAPQVLTCNKIWHSWKGKKASAQMWSEWQNNCTAPPKKIRHLSACQ